MKRCVDCNQSDLSEFTKDKTRSDGLDKRCKSCKKRIAKAYYSTHKEKFKENGRNFQRKNPEWMTAKRLARRYGLDLKTYKSMLAAQSGKCAICNRDGSEFSRRMAVDHNHKTGAVRGLLCTNCNTVLGKMNDNPALFLKAAEYLNERNH
jgi:transcription elongation factor Elf1